MALSLKSNTFAQGKPIPKRCTCDGDDVCPELQWEGEPEDTRSFALIMDDPDAPGGTWNHFLLWNIPSNVHSLAEGGGHLPSASSGTNDFGKSGYGGPCPPKGKGAHRYFFRLFAVDTVSLAIRPGEKRAALEKALHGHVLGRAEYFGTYERLK